MKKPKNEAEILEEAIQEAKASMELEGFTISEVDIEFVKKRASGEISMEEFLKLAREDAKRK